MKVVGIGYPRTGTKTLGTCFRTLGFTNATWMSSEYELFEEDQFDRLMNDAESYDSFEDLPWCLLYKEIDERFPNSKFILTLRKNERQWFESMRKHEVRIGNGIYWPTSGPKYDEEINTYRKHNASVRNYFKNRSHDLLEICWENGDGWEKLCTFLDKPVPSTSFPHANKTPFIQTIRLWKLFIKEKFSALWNWR